MSILENMHTINQKKKLTAKLLALYDLNKRYIDEAKTSLSTSHGTASETLMQEEIDRLFAHISLLEHAAKLLHENFLLSKHGQQPNWLNNDTDRRKMNTGQ